MKNHFKLLCFFCFLTAIIWGCNLFPKVNKTSIVKGIVINKFTQKPMKGIYLSVEIPQFLSQPISVGQIITGDDGKFYFTVNSDCPNFRLYMSTSNHEAAEAGNYNYFIIEDLINVYPYGLKEFFLSIDKDYDYKFEMAKPAFIISDVHNTKPFDKNDRLIVEYFQNGKIVKNNSIEAREVYEGDSLSFKPRTGNWYFLSDLYVKYKMTITKNGNTIIKEDSVFCKPTNYNSSISNRIDF